MWCGTAQPDPPPVPSSREIHDTLWQQAATPSIARRRIDDTRTTLSLRSFGITQRATANVRDFENVGFERVWNPLRRARFAFPWIMSRPSRPQRSVQRW
jgi:hypothetical protein